MTDLRRIIIGCEHLDNKIANHYHAVADKMVCEITKSYQRFETTTSMNLLPDKLESEKFLKICIIAIRILETQTCAVKFKAFSYRHLSKGEKMSYRKIGALCGNFDKSNTRRMIKEIRLEFLKLIDDYDPDEFIINKIVSRQDLNPTPRDPKIDEK